MELIAILERFPQDGHAGAAVARIANGCRELICTAPDDGQTMVNFLWDRSRRARRQRMAAEEWVRLQVDRYRREGNAKLSDRYQRLARFFRT